MKRLQDNESKLHGRHDLYSQIEQSIQIQDKSKKLAHKEEIKKEKQANFKKEQDYLMKTQTEYIATINEQLTNDISKIEDKYESMMKKLGAESVDQIKDIIAEKVIPNDIKVQSFQNLITQKLQDVGMMQG